MRRSLGTTVVVAVLTLLAATALAGEIGQYRDEFKGTGYAGSVGSLDWSTSPWSEIGEKDGPGSGAVHVDAEGGCVGSNCLHIFGEGVVVEALGAQRAADTSVFSEFEVCFEIAFVDFGNSDATIDVTKSVDGGETWYSLGSQDLYNGMREHPAIAIGGPYESFIVRFVVSGYLHGEIFIDDVEVKGTLAGQPTTTTTTEPTTTTTTKATTTTTIEDATTTTTEDSTTTTAPKESTTSTSTTTTTSLRQESTTTTSPETTSTSEAVIVVSNDGPPGGDGGSGTPPRSGIRQTARGIQASFDGQLFGDVPIIPASLNSVDHQANYRIAAEIIEASWVWLVILALVLAWSIVSGLERRRSSAEA